MKEHADDMVKACFAADSLALGVHWIYDAGKILSDHGRVDRLLSPALDSYHSTKNKGAFTHYGDQNLVMLESVAQSNGFDLQDYFSSWQNLFKDYDGYVDSATRTTLKHVGGGKGPKDSGSASNDIAGASRIAPIVLSLREDPEQLSAAVQAQTRMTHNDEATVEVADFFARVCLAGLNGIVPTQVIQDLADNEFALSPISMWVDQGLGAVEQESLESVIRFGQSCHTPEAFPGVIQIIAKYEHNPGQGIIEAVMAGGDNAARASLVAQVLSAYNGLDSQTDSWFQGVNKKADVIGLLEQIS